MDSNQLNVDPAKIRTTSDDFHQIAAAAKSILDDLFSSIAALGPFAGDDEIGNKFWGQFTPAVQAGKDLLSGISLGMQQTGHDLGNTADLYTAADHINTDIAPHPTHIV